ncbi:MAG: hypothetical protein C0481_02735 [Phenylobacterium sp.]|uniref:DUF7146 domain-containing protein n=1 Tax=Phenylobacterium sp. TaxID=1871053 RepID=UPI0025E954DE|nr:toprim domain-containing protein [Phenylobacterium sp.]MBA4010760.1 hypothetical protein [Phenylobacterium sp.]
MSLHDIVRALGGELYSGGCRASIPAPGHSPADRSVSLLVSDGRVIIHSFGEASWQAVRDDLLRRGLIDGHGTPVAGATFEPRSFAPAPTQIERVSRARALWEEASPVRPATPAWRHIRRRAISGSPLGFPSLRSHPQVPASAYRGCAVTRPALLAAIHDRSGELTGVEITYLTNGGLRASDMRLSRKTIGAIPAGSAVRFNPGAPSMVVGEGVFTTLSAIEHFGLPGWALLSTSNLRQWTPPEDVRVVVIAADRGVAGEAAAEALRHRLTARGVVAALKLPPEPFGDWNEFAQSSRR